MAESAGRESPEGGTEESPDAPIAVGRSAGAPAAKSRWIFGWLPWAGARAGEGVPAPMGDTTPSTPSDLAVEVEELGAEAKAWRGVAAKKGPSKAGGASKKAGWPLVLWLLAVSSVCAALAIFGYDHGWARMHKDNFAPRTNTYLAIITTVLTEHPSVAEQMPPGLLDVVTPLLPATNISIDIKLGWLERVLTLDIHSDELSPVITAFLERPELNPYRDEVDQVVVDRKIVTRNLYKDTGVEAQCTGAMVMALLSLSVLLSLGLFISFGSARMGKGVAAQRCGHFCKVAIKLSSALGLLLFTSAAAHYVALGYGTHKRTEENLIIEEGFISWPSWAWVFALVSAALWTLAGIFNMKGALPDPYLLLEDDVIKTFQDEGAA